MNRSEARRHYWSTIPKEERVERARVAANIRHSMMTEMDKEKLIKMLQEGRKNKKHGERQQLTTEGN